jgi:hypothetical protein
MFCLFRLTFPAAISFEPLLLKQGYEASRLPCVQDSVFFLYVLVLIYQKLATGTSSFSVLSKIN